jgi:MATE family multidrug resistance protein
MRPFTSEWIAEVRTIGGISASVTITMLAQLVISAVETLVVARLGTIALAGVTLALNVYLLVFLLALGVVTAVTPIAAQARGRGDEEGVRLAGQQALWVALLISLPGALLLLTGGTLFMHSAKVPEARAAAEYLIGAAWGLPAWVSYVAVRSFAVAVDRISVTTAIMLAAVPLHLVLTWWLVFGGFGVPALGALGAGIAYSLAAFLAWVALIIILRTSHRDDFSRAFSRPFTWNWPCIKEILWLGVPFAGRIVLAEGVLPVAGFIIAPFGPLSVAGYAISARIINLLSVFSFGFSEAANIRVGVGAGAGKAKQIKSAGWVAVQLSVVFNCFFATLLVLGPKQIAFWFLGGTNSPSLVSTTAALPFAAGVLVLGGFHTVVGGALSGIRDAKGPLFVTALCSWGFGLPLGFLLAHEVSSHVSGLWAGLLLGDLTAAILYLVLFRRWLTILHVEFEANS